MKNNFRRIAAFVFVVAILIPQFNVMGADIKLYEKYEYKEDFEYKDEIIGYALRTAVVKIELEYSARIKSSFPSFDNEQYDIEYDELLSFYSAEECSNIMAERLNSSIENYIEYTDSYVSETMAGTGSGVVISDDGYIATNAHVADFDDDTKQMFIQSCLENRIISALAEIESSLYNLGLEMDYDIWDQLYYSVIDSAQVSKDKVKLTVYFPAASGDTSGNAATTYEAEVIEVGTQEGIEGLTQDTAILKIDAKNLVALKLSSSYPALNSAIVTAGFPAASEIIFQEMGSDESQLSVTVTPGTVARLVPITDSKYKAIEITSTISGGNSGGPSVDKKLNIEGLNTYGLTDDMRYAYMIPAEYVLKLSKDCEIEQGEASKTFFLGLQMLQNDYGKTATECFKRVKKLQPKTPCIKALIEISEEAPQNEATALIIEEDEEEEKTAKKTKNKITRSEEERPILPVVIIGAVAGIVITVAIIVTIILLLVNHSKKKKIIKNTLVPRTPPMPPPAKKSEYTPIPTPAKKSEHPPMHSAFMNASLSDLEDVSKPDFKKYETAKKKAHEKENTTVSRLIKSKDLNNKGE